MLKAFGVPVIFAGLSLCFGGQASAATTAATYTFNGNFLALEAGAPPMVPIDPQGTSGFQVATVYGQPRTVYHFDGLNSPPPQQGGLTVNTTSLIAGNDYSAEMVLEFDQRNAAWRRLIDVRNRQSDSGFYVDPSNNLDIYPVGGSSNAFTTGAFHHVVLTDTGGVAKGYLDGTLQFTFPTTLMDVNNLNNPAHSMNFFLDNVVATGQGEWSPGDVALIRLYNGALSGQEVATLAADPFVNTPEPASLVLCAAGVPALLLRRRRAR
ncbi:MAG: sorting domain protein [Phycisphaerales bacterium]|nr:sorting domain protein [Phycisphaerales bacterium]